MAPPSRPARVPADRLLPLRWVGPLREPSGYADEGRSYLVALDRAGIRCSAHELRWLKADAGAPRDHVEAIERALAEKGSPGDEVAAVYHLVPHGDQDVNANGPTIARTMFETDSVPAAWLARLLAVDEVWVPCDFNVETFVRGGVPRERLHVLPETIDFELYDPAQVRPFELPGRRGTTFLANFDFTDRKGWDVLLDAWADAFDPDDDVCLVLKYLGLHTTDAEVRARLDAYLGGRRTAPLLLDGRVLPAAELPRLYASVDAFVLPSRGEGWGRPYMEAMAMGLPTIGSRWSGNLMFMHDGNSILLDGDLVRVPADAQRHAGSLYRGQRWFDPDREALAGALRSVAAGDPDVALRAGRARAELLERFGPEPTVARLVELVEGSLERRRARLARPIAAVWRGDWGSGHSLAIVNDGVVSALEAAGSRVERAFAGREPAAAAAVGVAGQWPPDFGAPSAGPYVLYQPFEYGAVPASWVEEIRRCVDEVWTPSEYARRAYVASGVAPELVHVVPNGVDLDRFAPAGPARELPPAATRFLFVGGTIHRKGIDLLLEAYGRAFGAADDVLLVVKGVGGATFYAGQTAERRLADFAARPDAPALVVLDEEVPFDEVPALYRAADVLVQPYRGEGFCLPALEALACGVPVIVTAGGPTDEFASDACAWRVAAERRTVPAGSFELPLAADGFLLEPDAEALAAALRAAADPARRAAKAAHARAHAERWPWSAAAAAARGRLEALAGRTPIRRTPLAEVPGRRARLFVVDADWAQRETWAAPLRAYAAAFGPDDDTTLVLPAGDEAAAVALVTEELASAGIDPGGLADVAVADPAAVGRDALELAADAVISIAGRRAARARRLVPPDPAALRAVANR